MPKTKSLEDLLVEELKDLFDAEKQLTRALPKVARAASTPELKEAIEEHLAVTKGQVERLEQVFEQLGKPARGKPCQAMKGLVAEAQELMEEDLPEELLDVGLIAGSQKIEHYEMAGYGTVRTLAQTLGHKEAAQLLEETLHEEEAADKKLTAIAKKYVNARAKHVGAQEQE
jgi:ferritin-like metal-binding protein YciE